jgi:anti-sigma regulatory factor (Ser/Thr protein kinase)
MTLAQILVNLEDPSGVGEARHRAGALASKLGLDVNAAGELAIAVTEAAGNIVKHAGRGGVLLRPIERSGVQGVETLAFDRGPGIANVTESMRDGYSTAGSPGTGLGALQRLTSALDIWTRPGNGVLLRFEIWPKAHRDSSAAGWMLGTISLPKPGETACGDGWALVQSRDRMLVVVVDGLGHGPAAATAARAAVSTAEKHAAAKPAEIIDAVHDALRPTRGAAAAVAELQLDKALCTFCGVGNISAAVRAADGASRSMVSHNGILGHQVRKLQEFQYPFPRGAMLLAHSDGIETRWDLASYPGLELRHPALVVAALYRDHLRGRDDATILAVRAKQASA